MNCKRLISLLLAVALVVSLVPHHVASAEEVQAAVITVEDSYAAAGATVSVDITIKNNPGILAMTLKLNFDESIATLVGVENGEAMSEMSFAPPVGDALRSGCQLGWDAEAVNNDSVKDGVIATLTFKVAENAAVNQIMNISISSVGNIVDNETNPVSAEMAAGKLIVLDYVPGDVNGDGLVTSTDTAYLRRYIAGGYGVTINEDAGDVNADGLLSSVDVAYIRRFIAGGYGVALLPGLQKCDHTMQATAAKAESCTTDGNIAYWYCTKCGKYFRDKDGTAEISLEDTVIEATGHKWVTVPGYAPDYGIPGLTDGIKCSVPSCGYVKQAQEEIPALQPDECYVEYNLYGTDEYLKEYLETVDIAKINKNPSKFDTTVSSHSLIPIAIDAIPGYEFQGWVDGYGKSANTIEKGTKGTVTRVATWKKTTYNVIFDSPLKPMDKVTRTIDEPYYLPQNMEWDHYVFMGWSDASGNIIEVIKPGTKDITVHANWTSNRNQARAHDYLKDGPIIIEDEAEKKYYFVYNIGQIINVPLETILDLGYRSSLGIEETVTKKVVLEKTEATTLNKAVEDATTNSSSWMLSKDWNELLTDVTGGGKEVASNQTVALSTGTSKAYGSSGSTYVGESFHAAEDNLTTAKTVTDDSFKTNVSASVGASYGPIKAEVSASADTAHSTHQENYSENQTSMSLDSSWNSTNSYNSSSSYQSNSSISNAIMKKAQENWKHEITKSIGGSDSQTQTGTVSNKTTEGYSSTMSFHSVEEEVTVEKVTSDSTTTPGYYRYVLAGDYYVYAVVCYDIATGSYSVTTQSILADDTKKFLDYSKNDPLYQDYNNAVLPFEVPVDIHNYIFDSLAMTDGLIIDKDTGTVTGYEGTAKNVFIPDYAIFDNDDGGKPDVVKITAFEPTVFAGKDVEMVRLSNYITEIPGPASKEGPGAFENCTALKTVYCNALTSIGERAFNGCTSLQEFTVAETVKELGKKAFDGVGKVVVNAANAKVAVNAVSSAAVAMTLNLNNLEDTLSNTELDVRATQSFTVNGYGASYSGLNIKSSAAATIISRMTFADNTQVPLHLKSANVTLNQVKIENAPALGMILESLNTTVTLQGKVSVTTAGKNAILSKNVAFVRKEGVIEATELNVFTKNVLVCGAVTNDKGYLKTESAEQIKVISGKEFEQMLESKTVYFNANGGTTPEASRVCSNFEPIGTLPVPELSFHTFKGWFTAAEGGTQITAGTVLPAGEAITLYAHWELNPLSDWAPASALPSGAQVVNRKWSYNLTTTTESRETSLDGYTQTGSYWVEQGRGSQNYATFPSGFNTSHSIYTSFAKSPYTAYENATSKRVVSNTHAGYVYWHWMYNVSYANNLSRTIADRKCNFNGFAFSYFFAMTSSVDCAKASSPNAYVANYVAGSAPTSYNCHSILPKSTGSTDGLGTPRMFRFDYYLSSYTDYYKMFQYKKVEAKESTTQVTASGTISDVQEWVQYRVK